MGFRARVAMGLGAAGIAACNLLTGAGDLESGNGGSLDGGCAGCDSDGPRGDGGVSPILIDSSLVSDVQKDGDDDTPGGFLDGTFGKSGVLGSGLLDVARAFALRDDGALLVAGVSDGHAAVVRVSKTGAIDTAFGTQGRAPVVTFLGSDARGIAVDSEGRAVVVGTTTNADEAGTHTYLLVARLLEDGKLDDGFAGEGRLVGGEGETPRAIVTASNGGVFVGGSRTGQPFVIGKINSRGELDAKWAPGGQVAVPVTGGAALHALAKTESTIVAIGPAEGDFAGGAVGVLDGGVVTSFRPRVSIANGNDVPFAVSVAQDGKILIGGETDADDLRSPRFGVTRVGADGKVDESFGERGRVTVTFPSTGDWREVDERLRGLIVDSRNRVVVAGGIFEKTFPPRPEEYRNVALARLTPNGQLDPLFGKEGKLTFSDSASSLEVVALTRSGDGKLYVLGNATTGGFFVARITP